MLFEIIYHSQASVSTDDIEIGKILETAREFNKEHNITGCLLYHNRQFLQILEGDFQILNELYTKIKEDKRHKNVVTLHMQEMQNRLFDHWTMAYQRFESAEILENHIGIRGLDLLLSEGTQNGIPKEIFATMSKHILEG